MATAAHLKISPTSLLLLSVVAVVCLLLSLSSVEAASESTQLAVARDDIGGGGWLARVLRELFDDIDWQAIEKAREQVEKFVRKVDRLIKSFRSTSVQQPVTTGSSSASSSDSTSDELAATSNGGHVREARLNPQGKWWSSGAKLAGSPMPATLAGELADASDVKAMLERVACFLGYMRILTDSNAALAELDAAKVVSNLFSSTGASTGAGGYFKRWFG